MPFPITLEQFDAAYASVGVKPIARRFARYRGTEECMCPMTVVVAEKLGKTVARQVTCWSDPPKWLAEQISDIKGDNCMTARQVDAFICGFDGLSLPSWMVLTPDHVEAYEAGKAAREHYAPQLALLEA